MIRLYIFSLNSSELTPEVFEYGVGRIFTRRGAIDNNDFLIGTRNPHCVQK